MTQGGRTTNPYTDEEIRQILFQYLISLYGKESGTQKEADKINRIVDYAKYVYLGHPRNYPKGEYLSVSWYRGPTEIFQIQKETLTPISSRIKFNPFIDKHAVPEI